MANFPEQLKFIRKKRGWSQEELARNLGVALNTVQRWEMGKNRPSKMAIEKLKPFIREISEMGQLRLF